VKVLFVEPFGHREGHPSFESRRVSYALVDAGAEITLLTFMGVHGDWADTEGKVAHVALFRPRRSARAYYKYLDRFPIVRSLLKILETSLSVSFALWKNRKSQYDVIHIFDSEPVFFVSLALGFFLSGYNIVFTVYNPPPPQENWRQNVKEFLRTRKWRILLHTLAYQLGESDVGTRLRSLIYRRAMKRNNVLHICHTEELVQSYASYMGGVFRGRFVCIPLGVERPGPEVSKQSARRHLAIPARGKIFLTFGNNHPGKDFEAIFQAFQGLPRDLIIFQAGKLGTASEEGDPVRLARKYSSCDNTIVMDEFVPESDKVYYFRAADAIVLSYKKNFVQSASIINDAARFSIPVIASAVGQVGEFVRTYRLGVTFAPEDPRSLREAVLEFLSMSEREREAMGHNSALFREAYPWDRNARDHLGVYNRLLESDGNGVRSGDP